MILAGDSYADNRGVLHFNNDFDLSLIKRIYTIENLSLEFIRGWQGHKVEQRWFTAIRGRFEVSVIKLDSFNSPSRNLVISNFILGSDRLDVLHIGSGCVTAIKSLEKESKLLVFADYRLGELDDEIRISLDYFDNFQKNK